MYEPIFPPKIGSYIFNTKGYYLSLVSPYPGFGTRSTTCVLGCLLASSTVVNSPVRASRPRVVVFDSLLIYIFLLSYCFLGVSVIEYRCKSSSVTLSFRRNRHGVGSKRKPLLRFERPEKPLTLKSGFS